MTADQAGRDQEMNRDPKKRENSDPRVGSWSESTYLGQTRTPTGTQDRTMDSPGGEAFTDPTRRFGERQRSSEGGPFYEDARRRSGRMAYRNEEYGRPSEYGRGVSYASGMDYPRGREFNRDYPNRDFPGPREFHQSMDYPTGGMDYGRDREFDREMPHERSYRRDYGMWDDDYGRSWEGDEFDHEHGLGRQRRMRQHENYRGWEGSAGPSRSRPQGWWNEIEQRQRQFAATARPRGFETAGRGFYGPSPQGVGFYDPTGYARAMAERSALAYGSMTYGPTYGMTGWEHAGAYGSEYPRKQPNQVGRRTRWEREHLTAGEIMTKDVKAVTSNDPLETIARVMKDENCGIVPVVDESRKLVGVVTDRDVVIRTLAEGRGFGQVKVADVMTDDVEAVTADESLHDVIELMGRKQVRRVPVVDRRDRLVGIISMADVANRADYDEELQDSLERISARRSFWKLWR